MVYGIKIASQIILIGILSRIIQVSLVYHKSLKGKERGRRVELEKRKM